MLWPFYIKLTWLWPCCFCHCIPLLPGLEFKQHYLTGQLIPYGTVYWNKIHHYYLGWGVKGQHSHPLFLHERPPPSCTDRYQPNTLRIRTSFTILHNLCKMSIQSLERYPVFPWKNHLLRSLASLVLRSWQWYHDWTYFQTSAFILSHRRHCTVSLILPELIMSSGFGAMVIKLKIYRNKPFRYRNFPS